MAPRHVRVLLISAGVIIVTGLLTYWMMGVDQSKIKLKYFMNPFTSSTDAAQTSVEALAEAEGVPNMPGAQTITNFPGATSIEIISGTSAESRASSAADIEEGSWQTPAERAAVSADGSVETTAGGKINSAPTLEEIKTAIISPVTKQADWTEPAETTPDETVTCTQTIEITDAETFTNPSLKSENVSETIQTRKSETDVAVLEKQTELSVTVPKHESNSLANIMTATPIPEPMTDRVIHLITDILKASKITSENQATTKTRPDATFRTAAIITKTKVDLTEGDSVAGTFINRLKSAGTETLRVEISETTTVRPQESTQAIKTSHAPTTINGASAMNLVTVIQNATGTPEKTKAKQLSTGGKIVTIKSNVLTTSKSILNTTSPKRQTVKVFKKLTTHLRKPLSPCKRKCQTKSTNKSTGVRRARVKIPLAHDKTLYSAITMGCILIICSILALTVFIKHFTVLQYEPHHV